MIYLSSPYTGTPAQQEFRFRAALKCTGNLINKDHHVFSPIVHCHQIATIMDLPHDYGFWSEYDKDMVTACDEVFVLAIAGWHRSLGVRDEIRTALKQRKPVWAVDVNGEFLDDVDPLAVVRELEV